MTTPYILVPATPDGLRATVVPKILAAGYTCVVSPMLNVDSYFKKLRYLWWKCVQLQEDLIIIEHDIEVTPDVFGHFSRCPHRWCSHSYEVYGGDLATAYGGPFGLGCVRFRHGFMAAHPEAVEEAGKMDIHPKHPQRSYAVMDSTLTQWLRGPCAETVHQHHPNVKHLHEYNRDGAYEPPEPPKV